MKFCLFIVFLLTFEFSNCEFYTALADLEELLETEAVLINTLEQYINAQEERLNLLRKYVKYQQYNTKKLLNYF